MKQNNASVGFTGLLTILLIGLKLTGYITWSWIWILAPLWISLALAIVISLIVIAVMVWSAR